MEARQASACPDLGLPREPGRDLVVPGTKHGFSFCPAGYLRTAHDVAVLRERRDGTVWAEHLIGGVMHPAELASSDGYEVEQGARTFDTLSARRQEMARLYLFEKSERDRNDMELRKETRDGGSQRR